MVVKYALSFGKLLFVILVFEASCSLLRKLLFDVWFFKMRFNLWKASCYNFGSLARSELQLALFLYF